MQPFCQPVAAGTPRRRQSLRVESSQRFRKLIKWRTGSEGRISHLKHAWGWERTMLDGIDGARTWCGWGVLAHNPPRSFSSSTDARRRSNPLRCHDHNYLLHSS